MSPKIFLFTTALTLLPQAALAQNLDAGLFYAIDDINSGKTKFNPSIAQCLTEAQLKEFEVAPEDMKYRQQCARALCGAPSVVPSVYVDKKNLSSYMTPALKYRIEELKPKLKAALEAIRKSKKAAIQDAEANLFKNGQFNFNPKSWENTDAFNEINMRTFEKYLKVEIDKNAPLGKKITYKIVNDGNMPANTLQGLADYKERLEKFKNSNPETLLKFDLLSKDEAKQFLKNQITSYEEALIKHSKKNASNRANNHSGKIGVKKLKDALAKPVTDTKDYIINLIADMYDVENSIYEVDPNFVGGSAQKACTTPNCMNAYQAYFQSINGKNLFENYKKGLDDPQALERSMTRCVANIIAAETMESSQVKSQKLFAEVLPTVLKNVVGNFSDQTKKHYTNYFNKQFAVSSKMISKGDLSNSATPLERYDQIFTSVAADPVASDYDEATTLREIIRHSDGEIPNPLASSQFCNSDPIANSWDSYFSVDRAKTILKMQGDANYSLPEKDTLYVSPFTCNHAAPGKSIVAHELGHAINEGFLKKKSSSHSAQIYMKLRKCVSSNHVLGQKAIDNPELSFQGDYLKTEEDTADLIAFMAYKNEQTPYTCSLLKQDDTNSKFIDLYLAEDEESIHSPSFYRLMMEAINKGIALPPSCQVVVDKSKSLIGFQKCLE